MSTVNEHPMDDFPVRPLTFDLSVLNQSSIVWSRTCPQFSVFVNALGVHVPYFERYLIVALRKAKAYIKDAKLLRDVSAIIGQEAHHAKNFIDFNKVLASRYPKVAAYDQHAKEWFAHRAATDSMKRLVGFTAGYETFTFLGGMIVLENYDRWFADSDPTIKAMWVWHQVEEVEHGAVAFDVYKHLFGQFEMYRKWMVLAALLHIAGETLKGFTHMAKVEGWLRRPILAVSRMSFCCYMLWRFVRSALPVFRKGYHPRHHPYVTTRQNPIQIAWRRYEKSGGDVLQIDHEKMATILGMSSAVREHPAS
jgi:predicted metal-dependent hydrolase